MYCSIREPPGINLAVAARRQAAGCRICPDAADDAALEEVDVVGQALHSLHRGLGRMLHRRRFACVVGVREIDL